MVQTLDIDEIISQRSNMLIVQTYNFYCKYCFFDLMHTFSYDAMSSFSYFLQHLIFLFESIQPTGSSIRLLLFGFLNHRDSIGLNTLTSFSFFLYFRLNGCCIFLKNYQLLHIVPNILKSSQPLTFVIIVLCGLTRLLFHICCYQVSKIKIIYY